MRILSTVLASLLAVFATLSTAYSASQQILGSRYEAFADPKSCYNASVCVISFPAIPAGKTILVDNVSCQVVSTKPVGLLSFGPATVAEGSLLKSTGFLAGASAADNNLLFQSFESQSHIMLGAGRFPTVAFSPTLTSAYIYMTRTVTGSVL